MRIYPKIGELWKIQGYRSNVPTVWEIVQINPVLAKCVFVQNPINTKMGETNEISIDMPEMHKYWSLINKDELDQIKAIYL